MSFEEIDKEEMMIFLEEVDELLQVLEEDILKLEKDSENPSLIAEIFRAAHTIKGSSASVGFTNLSKLAHAMEAVFSEVRSGKLKVSANLIDTFFHSLDGIKGIRQEIENSGRDAADIEQNLQMLSRLTSAEGRQEAAAPAKREAPAAAREAPEVPAPAPPPQAAPVPPAPPPPEAEPAQSIYRKYRIHADVTKGCLMPFVRAYQVLTFLSESGEMISSSPEIREIEAEEKSFPLRVFFSTTCGEERIREILRMIPDVIVIDLEEDGSRNSTEQTQPPEAAEAVREMRPPEPVPEPVPEPKPEPVHVPEPVQAPVAAEAQAPPVEVPETSLEPAGQAPPAVKSKAEEPQGAVEKQESKEAQMRSVRVSVERVDAIMDLVGELVINRTRLTQLSRALEIRIDAEDVSDPFNETSDNIELITSQLQEHIMKARLLPIENVFNKFPRMVRSLATKYGKKIDLVVTGEKTELDRSVLEQIGDPLMHAIRNSVDHGIETVDERKKLGKPTTGKIHISASHIEDHVLLVIEDDGKGIDTQKVMKRAREMNVAPPEVLASFKEQEILNLVFTPAFSTKEEVTEVSGRGVGMDVVRTNIEKLNGTVSLESVQGKGTKLSIKLPLTLAIIKSLLVTFGHRIFAVPLISVVQTLRMESRELKTVSCRETIMFRGGALPLLRIDEVFGLKRRPNEYEPKKIFIVVVSLAGRKAGLIVDSLIGDQDIVIRPLGEYIGEVPGISGAAILGDGNIALIVDVGGIIEKTIAEGDACSGAASRHLHADERRGNEGGLSLQG